MQPEVMRFVSNTITSPRVADLLIHGGRLVRLSRIVFVNDPQRRRMSQTAAGALKVAAVDVHLKNRIEL